MMAAGIVFESMVINDVLDPLHFKCSSSRRLVPKRKFAYPACRNAQAADGYQRDEGNLNGNLAFGHGPTFCMNSRIAAATGSSAVMAWNMAELWLRLAILRKRASQPFSKRALWK